MLVTYEQRDQIFKLVKAKVDEETKGVQNLVANSQHQRNIRSRYIEGMQQALLFLNEVLSK